MRAQIEIERRGGWGRLAWLIGRRESASIFTKAAEKRGQWRARIEVCWGTGIHSSGGLEESCKRPECGDMHTANGNGASSAQLCSGSAGTLRGTANQMSCHRQTVTLRIVVLMYLRRYVLSVFQYNG